MLDRLTRVRRMVLIAALGPDSSRIVALFRRELDPLDAELHRLIAERRVAPDLAARDDVLSTLLLARDEDGHGLSDAELRDELMTLLVAGHETTATRSRGRSSASHARRAGSSASRASDAYAEEAVARDAAPAPGDRRRGAAADARRRASAAACCPQGRS